MIKDPKTSEQNKEGGQYNARPSDDYIRRLSAAVRALDGAEYLLIGGGAGLSDAAGIRYFGPRFTDNFGPFIQKYGMPDMYSAGFYPFKTEEERSAYWAKHICVNRYDPPAQQLYLDLFELIRDRKYFVITTNVDYQFYKAGFAPDRIFAVQGDYGMFQCARGCHKKLYPNEALVRQMTEQTADCRIPSALVPRCPVCGGPMEVNIRKDRYFVEDEAWHQANEHYGAFLDESAGRRLVLLELGVGFNTPGIIRIPFEQMTYRREDAILIRMNNRHCAGPRENEKKTVPFTEDMGETVKKLREMRLHENDGT